MALRTTFSLGRLILKTWYQYLTVFLDNPEMPVACLTGVCVVKHQRISQKFFRGILRLLNQVWDRSENLHLQDLHLNLSSYLTTFLDLHSGQKTFFPNRILLINFLISVSVGTVSGWYIPRLYPNLYQQGYITLNFPVDLFKWCQCFHSVGNYQSAGWHHPIPDRF